MKRCLVAVLMLAPSLVSADALEDGKRLLKNRQYREAIVQLSDAAKSDSSGEATYCLGVAFELSGDVAKAREQYRAVVAGNGKRAADAQRYLKALDTIASETAAAEKAKADVERAAIAGSQRLKDVRQRIVNAETTISERERTAQQKLRERDAAIAAAGEAKLARDRASGVLEIWKNQALAAPAGRGRPLRALGTVLYAIAGVGLGASVWYARTADTATTKIKEGDAAGMWTTELDWYVKYGESSDKRLPYTLAAGGGLFILGTVLLGLGESATSTAEDPGTLMQSVEGVQ